MVNVHKKIRELFINEHKYVKFLCIYHEGKINS